MKKLFAIAIFLLAAQCASAVDTYFALTAQGANTGANCANAHIWSDLLSSTFWVPDNVNHVCGVWYFAGSQWGAIVSAGSGTAGHPIIIKFESGAQINADLWNTVHGGIYITHDYVTITGANGGTQGLMQNMLNGTAGASCPGGTCSIQSAGTMIQITGAHDIVTNLTLGPAYIHTPTVSDGGAGEGANAISINGANDQITQNTITDCGTCISVSLQTVNTGVEIDHNTITRFDHGMAVSATVNTTGIIIHDNDISNMAFWDSSCDGAYHHDGIIHLNSGSEVYTNMAEYNNWFHGPIATNSNTCSQANAWIFDDLPNTALSNYMVFNNLLQWDSNTFGFFDGSPITGNVGGYYNNTIMGQSSSHGIHSVNNFSNSITENNIFASPNGSGVNMQQPAPNVATVDYNLYYQNAGGTSFIAQGTSISFATWQGLIVSPPGYDAHSLFSIYPATTFNPLLNANGTISSGASSAIGAGKNLTSLGVAALNVGAPQTFGVGGACGTGCIPRPAVGNWDLGANPFSASTVTPTVPTGTLPLITCNYTNTSRTSCMCTTANAPSGWTSLPGCSVSKHTMRISFASIVPVALKGQ